MTILPILVGLFALAVGIVGTIVIQRRMASNRAKLIVEEANREAEVIKKNKILEAREEEIQIKAEAEKQANSRLAKVQQSEQRIKQREQQLNQQQGDIARRRNEIDGMKANLDAQMAVVESKQEELDKLNRAAQTALEHISGLSSEEAKEKLIESLKDEAKTAAASYINDIMDEAKMTANKEAKRIVVQSIQRVATETAIECSISIPMKSKVALSVARVATSVLLKRLPVLKSS